MREVRFQEFRQLAYSYPVHLAHATVGATDNEDLSRQIFVKVHGNFLRSPPSFLPLLLDQKQSQRLSQVKGLWPHYRMGGEQMSHCQRSMKGRRYFGSHIWKMQSAWEYLGKGSTDGRVWPTAWLQGPLCSAQTIETHAATSGPSVLFWETLTWVNHRGVESFLNLHTEPPGINLPYAAKVLLARLVRLGAQIEILNDVKVSSLPSRREAASEGRLSGVGADGGQ